MAAIFVSAVVAAEAELVKTELSVVKKSLLYLLNKTQRNMELVSLSHTKYRAAICYLHT